MVDKTSTLVYNKDTNKENKVIEGEQIMKNITTVQNVMFEYWGDTFDRCTYARNCETKEIKVIKHSGYLTNDLSVRKAIANAFGLESFRKH